MINTRLRSYKNTKINGIAVTKEPIGRSVLFLGLLITSYFYVLPFGRFSFTGILSDFRLYDFMFIFFMIVVGVKALPRLKPLISERGGYFRWIQWLIVLIWASLIITTLTAGMSALLIGIVRAFRFSAYLLTGMLTVVLVENQRQYRFLLGVIFVNILVQAGLGFAQGMGWLSTFWPDYWVNNYGAYPVGTLSPHHKQIGVVMILGVAIGLALFRYLNKKRMWRLILGVLMAVMIAVQIFAESRTAWLGIGGLVLAYLFIHRRNGLVIGIGLIILFYALFTLSGEQITTTLQDSIQRVLIDRLDRFGIEGLTQDRMNVYDNIPDAVFANPWVIITGTGYQNISFVLHATGAHNNYLQAWFELGIIGFIVYIRMLIAILKTLWRTVKVAQSKLEIFLAQDIWVGFVAVMATMLVGESLWGQYSMFTLTGQIMTLVGLAVAPRYWKRSATADKTPIRNTH